MPTTLRRHQVTEIPAVRQALQTAKIAYPDETSPVQLIYKLIEHGEADLRYSPEVRRTQRRLALQSLAVKAPWPHEDGWLEQQREQWQRQNSGNGNE